MAGRKKKEESKRKTKAYRIRLTEDEMELLKMTSYKLGLKESDVVRHGIYSAADYAGVIFNNDYIFPGGSESGEKKDGKT